jgi:transposase InsO family protein
MASRGCPRWRATGPDKRRFKTYLIGYFHIDIAEVRTEEGRLYLLAAIDRTSKFAYVELHEKVTTGIAGDFLRALIQAVPYRVHTVLTDHGIHFATEFACAQNKIDHRLTKPRHSWTNGRIQPCDDTIARATTSFGSTSARAIPAAPLGTRARTR